MTLTYKWAFYGLVGLLGVLWLGSVEYRVRQMQGAQAPPVTAAMEWLFQGTNIRTPEGEALTRAMMLDRLLNESVVEDAQAPVDPEP
jgi:hypothetical protein